VIVIVQGNLPGRAQQATGTFPAFLDSPIAFTVKLLSSRALEAPK
jgi:hypothetical protein